MSNNYFNFKIPDFNERWGEDWSDFQTIIDDNVDHLIEKIVQLYWLKKPDRMTVIALELAMRFRQITIVSDDTLAQKRYKLRHYNSLYKEKSLGSFYLDPVESIVGTAGDLYLASDLWDGWILDEFVFGDPDHGIFGGIEEDNKWTFFFDVKTTDAGLLDQILECLRDKPMVPAFYRLILIDSSWNILEVV